ncbi:MAG: SDR family oxidoreductase [Vicinamibacterales bacterium]
MASGPTVVITGASGFLGRALAYALVERGHRVRAVVRPGSAGRVPPGAEVVEGDALDRAWLGAALEPGDTLVHLVGALHPNPFKAREFIGVDLASIAAAVAAGSARGIAHLVYVSVAHPSPVMQAYVAARREGEALVGMSHLRATVLRPFYVTGPGRRWPLLLAPLYWLAGLVPAWRGMARRLAPVTRGEMVAALIRAVESPPVRGARVVEVADIRSPAPSRR